MKITSLSLAFLTSATLLLSSCGSNDSASTATSETMSEHGDMDGMDHGTMNHDHDATGMMGIMHASMDKMQAEKTIGNTDHDFAHLMMAHHQGAVDMSELQLKEGKDATLRAMAEKIIADQKKEIATLETFATRLDGAPSNYKPTDANDPFTSKMKSSMDVMMKDMPKPTGNTDQDFAMLMIPHHQSAVEMAKAQIAHGRDPKLKEMAQQMIAAQQKEIQQFQAWQAKNGGKTDASAAVYECPMNCEGSKSDKPGKCPVCGMNLEKKA
ncbi:DUF305 domain-containing protein [Hymenobacter arizonensis]|nr:DUF305 domain-containing protein [Hymenobacter arizonensis]